MKDGAYLLWIPDKNEHCEYLQWRTLTGHTWGTNWLADDGNLALTWITKWTTKDCAERTIQLSDQGIPFRLFPVRKWARRPSKFEDVGIITASQLASALQALNLQTTAQIKFAFMHAMSMTCKTMSLLVEVLKAEVLANPTLAVRALLGKPNVFVRAGGMAIEVWPCQELPDDFYQWIPMNETCTKEVPLKFVHGGSEHTGYLDPVTNIIHQVGAPVDCALSEEIPLTISGVTYLYDCHSGTLTKPSQLRTLPFVHWNFSELLPLQPTIFHEITMYRWTELQSTISLNDVLGTLDRQRQILNALGARSQGDPPAAAQEAISGIMKQGFFGFLSGLSLNWWQVWVFICCIYVTLVILITHCCPTVAANSLKVNLPEKVQKLRAWWKHWRGQAKPKKTSKTRQAVRFKRREGEELIQVISSQPENSPPVPRRPDPALLRTSSGRNLPRALSPPRTLPAIEWPPRMTKATAFYAVSTAEAGQAPLPPLIPVQVQGILVAALLDTGSSITLIDEELADQLPVNLITEPALGARSITGHSLELIKAAQVEIQIGHHKRGHTVHVVRGSPHRCVLGVDLLPKYGLMS